VPQFARLMSVETALKLFFGFSQLLIVTGAIALERQIRGRHLVSGLAALLVLFNVAFNGGLLNKKISPHVLRHTCAMIVLQATQDIRKVSLWLGHSNLATTEIYTRGDPSETN